MQLQHIFTSLSIFLVNYFISNMLYTIRNGWNTSRRFVFLSQKISSLRSWLGAWSLEFNLFRIRRVARARVRVGVGLGLG